MKHLVSAIAPPASAVVLALALGAPSASAHPLQSSVEGPPPAAGAAGRIPSAPKPVRATEKGTVALKVSADRELTSTGMIVRRGDVVSVRAWGRVRVARAGNSTVYPEGLNIEDPYKPLPDETTCRLLAVVGDDNLDYVPIGRDAEFTAEHDGVLFFTLNQSDFTGNSGEFDVRVTVGERRGLAFGVGGAAGDQTVGGAGPAAAPTSTAAPSAAPAVSNPDDKTVTVSARLDWTTTAITLHPGDRVTIEATGSVTLNLAGDAAGPDGIGRPDPGKLIPDKPTGALVAVVGTDNNDFMFVGSKATLTSARDGLLFLGVNEDDLTNNSGSFSARVRVVRAPRK